jgi:hypothetical protein
MCLVFLIALFAPRVALGLMWIFGERVDNAFVGVLWPILGLIFFPWATIMYVLLWDPVTGVTSGEWLIVIAAGAVDVISWMSRLAKTSRPYG